MSNIERDYIGDQIGWAVRQQLSPTPQLRKLDQIIMKSLPKFISRPVALFRFEKGWLPEKGNPLDFYKDYAQSLVKKYLDSQSQLKHANTVILQIVGEPVRVHSSNFGEGIQEIPIHWDKQVRWAQDITERRNAGETVLLEDAKESLGILMIQNEMINLREQLKPYFIRRGLPFPWAPSDTPYFIAPLDEQAV